MSGDAVEESPEDESQQHSETASPLPSPLLINGKQLLRRKLRRYDSLDVESAKCAGHHPHGSKQAMGWPVILSLAFQSIGIVYGDIGTSPLYVYSSTFTEGIKHNDDILGVLALILYTITLIPLIKYVFIVLRATDNGDGGTFALYSLICRYTRVGLIPSQQSEDQDVSNFRLELPSNRLLRASRLKSKLEKSRFAKFFLLFATMLGTSMVIGDGVLTPCISGGIKQATSAVTEDMIVWISVAILVCLFLVQRFGTDKVGYSFAPIICVWFTCIGAIGLYNFVKYDPGVVKAINPIYIVDYFRRNKKEGWISLGGIVLAITGTEALFADVGHFTVRSIQISMCTVTYPSLILAYAGQASFLRKHNSLFNDPFYKSIPGPLYWPMFVLAILAAIIASQAMISGTFSIIQQSLSLGCFPRVKIVHTSSKYEGQVYIPEINYLLMLACVAVTLGFRTTEKIGNAYGIAVVFVMTLTSAFLELNVFRCVVRYGYTDSRNEHDEPFERLLFHRLKEFVREEHWTMTDRVRLNKAKEDDEQLVDGLESEENCENGIEKEIDDEANDKCNYKAQEASEREISVLDGAWRAGVVHLIGFSSSSSTIDGLPDLNFAGLISLA
ncbi:hypothetical protein NL676_023434 [Syzygium grande]|nr:hypothetical protein NL676_023434 [Syzygium grande]